MRLFWPVYLTVAIGGSIAIYQFAPRFRLHTPSSSQTIANVGTNVSSPAAENEASHDSMPPGSYGVAIARSSDTPTWGITIREASRYSEAGKRLGSVKGGEILHFQKRTTSSKGDVVVCSFPNSPGIPRDDFQVVQKKSVLLFTGTFEDLPQDLRDALIRYYQVRAESIRYKDELLVKLASKNPYFSEYQRQYKAYVALTERAETLERKRQNAQSNLKRSQLLNQLEHLRLKEARMKERYQQIREKYNRWKKENSSLEERVRQDEELLSLQREMRTLGRKIPGLAI